MDSFRQTGRQDRSVGATDGARERSALVTHAIDELVPRRCEGRVGQRPGFCGPATTAPDPRQRTGRVRVFGSSSCLVLATSLARRRQASHCRQPRRGGRWFAACSAPSGSPTRHRKPGHSAPARRRQPTRLGLDDVALRCLASAARMEPELAASASIRIQDPFVVPGLRPTARQGQPQARTVRRSQRAMKVPSHWRPRPLIWRSRACDGGHRFDRLELFPRPNPCGPKQARQSPPAYGLAHTEGEVP
jgi:hypothetical protein